MSRTPTLFYLSRLTNASNVWRPTFIVDRSTFLMMLLCNERKLSESKVWCGKDLFVNGKNYANVHLFDPQWYGEEDTLNYGSNYKFYGA